ncbi:hypothetical protein APSETT445_000697 [Aspergillus pseudonomiae]
MGVRAGDSPPTRPSERLLYFFYPETANLSLEEIDSLFMHKSPQSLDSSEEWKEPIVVTTSVETLKE